MLALERVVAFVVAFGYEAAGIDEVTVLVVLLDVAEGVVGLVLIACLLEARLVAAVEVVGIPVVVGIVGRHGGQVVVVALVEVEAIEVVGHFAVVERLALLLDGIAMIIGMRYLGVGIVGRIVAVDYLDEMRGAGTCRFVEDGMYAGEVCARSADPAVLDVARTLVHDTSRGEAARDAEVIDVAAEGAEERVVQSADGIAVAVEDAFEALSVVADWRPVGVLQRSDVALEEELEVSASLDVFVHSEMAIDGAAAGDGGRVAVAVHRVVESEVVEVLQEVKLALGVVGAFAVVDVDFAGTGNVLMVNEQVARMVHHGVDVVVVGHGELHGVGVRLAEVGLSIVGHIVVVLIPVHRREVVEVRYAVGVMFGIGLVGEHLPSAADDLEGTRSYVGLLQAHGAVGQHDGRLLKLADARHAALELEVDVDDVLLGDFIDVSTRLVALLVGVAVDDGNHLLLAEVVDVGLAGYIEGRGADRYVTVDGEVNLFVRQLVVLVVGDDGADGHS